MAADSTTNLLEEFPSGIRQRLCDAHPYLNRDAFDRMLQKSMNALEEGMKAQYEVFAPCFPLLPLTWLESRTESGLSQ